MFEDGGSITEGEERNGDEVGIVHTQEKWIGKRRTIRVIQRGTKESLLVHSALLTFTKWGEIEKAMSLLCCIVDHNDIAIVNNRRKTTFTRLNGHLDSTGEHLHLGHTQKT